MQLDNVEDVYPLSPMQQGLLFHSLYSANADLYVRQMACEFPANFDVSAFKRAWQRVIDRHAILRTAFFWDGLDEPLQVVRQQVALPWTCLDWSALPAVETQKKLSAFVEADLSRGFDFLAAPVMRLAVIRLTENTYRFIWSFHHLLLDGWSAQSLLAELLTSYRVFCQGRDLKLPAGRPYRDYIEWLGQQDLTSAEAYWRRKLKGMKGPTRLADDKGTTSAADQSRNYAEEVLVLDIASTERLNRFARQHKLTLYTLVAGAWALLMSRNSGEKDVVFGATVSGRPADLPGIEDMIGLFINTLPVRVEVEEEAPVVTWLRTLQEQQAEMSRYEYSPLVEIQGWSEVPRTETLFESIFVFENYPMPKLLKDSDEQVKTPDTRFVMRVDYPLVVEVLPGEEVVIKFTYDTAHFEEDAIRRMLKQCDAVLKSLIEHPEQKIREIGLLTEAEKRQLLVEWNDTQTEYQQDRCLQELIGQQVKQAGDRVAVVYDEAQITYSELNRRANQLANYLNRQGVGPEVLVGIHMERSLEMIVGMLGIVKAGGAYLPLDPNYPTQRLITIMQDAQPTVVLTQRHLQSKLPQPYQVLCLDSEWDKIAVENAENPQSQSKGDDLAYVLYTSGTTGIPKGTLITHRGLMNYLHWATRTYDVARGEGAPVHSPTTSDLTVTSLFTPLLAGQKLVLIAEEFGIDALCSALADNPNFSLLKVTPAHLEMLNQQLSPETAARCCRVLVIGGEALAAEKLAFWRRYAPDTRLINEYGPTETVVGCCVYEVAKADAGEGMVSIGRPIDNTQLYLMDSRYEPVPIGVSGELYIGGEGVARGYLNRADLTAEKFIPDAYGEAGGARLYRSGDLARYMADGNIEFQGRIDEQVKIRGYRIEPGEIEAVLLEQAGIREAVVIAREDEAGMKRLVAYLVNDDGQQAPAISELRAHLKMKLPEYMIPAAFVMVQSLPLSANGKVDRRALPAPGQSRPESPDSFIRPRTIVEEMIAQILAEVLGLERVEIDDNFFELGGHSLLAVRVASRAREAFQAELSVRTLFEEPTVAGLARCVEKAIAAAEGLESPPIVAVERNRELRLSFEQERLWFLEQLELGSAAYNNQAATRFRGHINVETLEEALSEIVRRHEVLRTVFPAVDGRPTQVIQTVQPVLLIVDLSLLPRSEQERVVHRLLAEETRSPFDLSNGPILRVRLVRLDPGEHILVLGVHHIAFDALSTDIFFKEVYTLYKAFKHGRQSPLEELPVQYCDYAHWQREWLQGDTLKSSLSYWKRQLSGAPSRLDLPADRPRSSDVNPLAASSYFLLPKSLTDSLRELSRQENVTLFMVLMAAFQTLLSRYSGQEDISVGTPVAGRDRLETEALIGCFINTLVLRNQLPGEMKFRELLQRTRQVTLEAYAHQVVPFAKIVDALRPEVEMDDMPLYQVLFNLIVSPAQAPAAAEGLMDFGSTWQPAGTVTARLDLIVDLREVGGEFAGKVEYRTDLFEPETITRMVGHFETLLRSIVADPDTRLSRLELLTEAEKHQQALSENSRVALNRRKLAAIAPRPVRVI